MLAALHLYEQTGDDALARALAAVRRRAARAVPHRPRARLPDLDPVPPRPPDPEHRRRPRLRLERPLAAARRGPARRGARRGAPRGPRAETAATLAIDDGGLVNWPTAADPFWAEDFPIRVQWCHGAPGPRHEPRDPSPRRRDRPLLAAAGELDVAGRPASQGRRALPRHGRQRLRVPRAARPHGRGALAPSRPRLRDARARAGGAIATATPRSGRGDIGVALYLRACLDGWDGMPVLDVL